MIFLHVLKGLHAGAAVGLLPGRYCIQKASDRAVGESDLKVTYITLFDWSDAALHFCVSLDEKVSTVMGGELIQPVLGDTWIVGERFNFGNVVVALDHNPAQVSMPVVNDRQVANCPTSISILSPPPHGARSWSARAYCVGAALLVAVTALYGHTGGEGPGTVARTEFDFTSFISVLKRRGLDEILVESDRGEIILGGMVRNAVQGRIARLTVNEFAGNSHLPILIHWEIADEIESTIETALGDAGVRVRYMAGGRFRIEGLVNDPTVVEGNAAQLLKDLGKNVKRFEFALEAIKRERPVNSAMSAGPLIYSERQDGAKVFVKDMSGT